MKFDQTIVLLAPVDGGPSRRHRRRKIFIIAQAIGRSQALNAFARSVGTLALVGSGHRAAVRDGAMSTSRPSIRAH
ncbi:MAG: hypothetical protein KF858_16880 [Candidatus Sumerlaeia bacterium]|nr:hypothetical protein [Candidatus Sumerlaeia bacterium]